QGVSVVHLYGEHLKKIKVAYPSIEEQTKIAELLSLIDRRISTQNKIIEQLQSLIKGIVVEHFNNTQKTKVKIKDLGKSYSVMNMSKEDLSETGNECIIYGELFTTYDCVAVKIVSKTQKAVPSSTVSTGYDLLFPASTTVDAQSLIAPTAVSIPNIILGGDMFGIAVKQEFNNEYLSYAFNYIYKKHLAQYAQGSTIIHLHYNDIKNLYIGIPDKITQDKLVTLLKSMQDKILTEKKMLSMLETQKAYLLRNLFI
ncbi:MAG: restriction endonuclease subunit S, partial [Clostridia bacterium]|nr:restriction endonuclease subunit S [Clostridia bacterium]